MSLATFGYGDLTSFPIFEFFPTLGSLLGGLFRGATIERSGRGGNPWLATFVSPLGGGGKVFKILVEAIPKYPWPLPPR
jgi:hypothetical protein